MLAARPYGAARVGVCAWPRTGRFRDGECRPITPNSISRRFYSDLLGIAFHPAFLLDGLTNWLISSSVRSRIFFV